MKHVHYNYEPLKAGSFYYSDGTHSNELDESKTCIGICVIPKDFLPDGKARIMSLKEMDYNNIESGSLQHIPMYWGSNKETSLTYFNKVTIVVQEATGSYEGTNVSYNDRAYSEKDAFGFLPSDISYNDFEYEDWDGEYVNDGDKYTTWHKDVYNYLFMPSPYMKVNGKEVLCPQYNTNATSDFDGKEHTIILKNLFKKARYEFEGNYGYYKDSINYRSCYPPAMCCSGYKTEGTKVGDWYLPSIGELGFVIARLYEIKESILALGSEKALELDENGRYWSSTEYSSESSLTLKMGNGSVDYFKKNYEYNVRAFLKVE